MIILLILFLVIIHTNNCTNDYTKKAILCPTNEAWTIINEQILGKIEGKLQNYYSIDSIDSNDIEEITNFPIEFLNSINITGLPPHKLSTKVGDLVLFGKWSGTEVKIDGVEYSIMKESDIMGIMSKKK